MSIAQRIIEKCGGVAKTAEIVGRSQSWVHRWTYPKHRGGTGGQIPRAAQEALLAADIGIEPADFFDAA